MHRFAGETIRQFGDLPKVRPKLIGTFGQPNAGDDRRRNEDYQDRSKPNETGTGYNPFVDDNVARAVEYDREQRPVWESPVWGKPVRYRKIDLAGRMSGTTSSSHA